MSLTALIPLLINISIMLSVIAIGLRATFKDTTHLLHRPALLARALLSMNVVMPAVAVLIALTFNLNPAVKISSGGLVGFSNSSDFAKQDVEGRW